MAIKTDTNSLKFKEGRGGGRGLPVTDSEDMARENETQMDPFPMQDGATANDYGGKPIFAVDSSFSRGRGPGRGHGTEK